MSTNNWLEKAQQELRDLYEKSAVMSQVRVPWRCRLGYHKWVQDRLIVQVGACRLMGHYCKRCGAVPVGQTGIPR
jgi:hypothetical protein